MANRAASLPGRQLGMAGGPWGSYPILGFALQLPLTGRKPVCHCDSAPDSRKYAAAHDEAIWETLQACLGFMPFAEAAHAWPIATLPTGSADLARNPPNPRMRTASVAYWAARTDALPVMRGCLTGSCQCTSAKTSCGPGTSSARLHPLGSGRSSSDGDGALRRANAARTATRSGTVHRWLPRRQIGASMLMSAKRTLRATRAPASGQTLAAARGGRALRKLPAFVSKPRATESQREMREALRGLGQCVGCFE